MYSDSKFLIFRGLSVHYRVLLPQGPVLHRALLVPSPGQSTYNWRMVVPELLSLGCLCVLCDLPGFGYSMCGPGVPHRQDQRARLLWGVLDEVDMEYGHSFRCWNLIGHGSAAGTVAMMALSSPESVASLVMINPILTPIVGAPLRRLARSEPGKLFLRRWHRRHLTNRVRFRKLARWYYGKAPSWASLEEMRKPFMRMGSDASISKLVSDGYQIPLEALEGLFVPTLVLWGGRDKLLGGQIPHKLRAHLKNAEFHLMRQAGHCAPETNSRMVCDYLRGWLRAMG